MGYEERETSVYEGDPVECYQFTRGPDEWLFTSADSPVTLPVIGTFTPAAVVAGGIELREEDSKGGVEIQLPRTSPVTAPFVSAPPVEKTWVRVYRAHRGAEDDHVCIFLGWIDGAPIQGSVAVAKCVSILSAFKRRVPGLAATVKCNHALYGAGCGVNREDFRVSVTVIGVSGAFVMSDDFGTREDGWFQGGYLERSNGDRRFIVYHVGGTVQLMSPFPDLATSEVVSAYAGCDLTREVCLARFNNVANFLGFEHMPLRDPHTQRV